MCNTDKGLCAYKEHCMAETLELEVSAEQDEKEGRESSFYDDKSHVFWCIVFL